MWCNSIYILTDVVEPQMPSTTSPVPSSVQPLTRLIVIAMISDSNFITLGQISGCKGLEIEYMLKA